jgi:mannosyltransferase OCH1-like enzyme
MIPKIINQIWLQGKKSAPENNIKKINRDWHYILWDDKMIRKLIDIENDPKLLSLYNNLEKFAYKADIGRVLILKHIGGVYLDIDYKCSLPLNKIIDFNYDINISNCDITTNLINKIKGDQNNKSYNSSFIASTKNHPVWNDVLDKMKTCDVKNNNKYINIFGENIATHIIYKNISTAISSILSNSKYKIYKIPVSIVNIDYCNNNKKAASCTTPMKSSWNIFRNIYYYSYCISKYYIICIIILLIIIKFVYT